MSDFNSFSSKKFPNDEFGGGERKPTLVTQTINLQTHAVCSESPTILITNYSHNNSKASSSSASINPNPNGSITIYKHESVDMESVAKMQTPSINITIKNHFDRSSEAFSDDIRKPSIKIEKPEPECLRSTSTTSEQTSAPGSSSGQGRLRVDDDVLVKHQDSRLYLGTVIELNDDSTECLVKYDDESVRWTAIALVTKLNSAELDEKPTCIICKDSTDPKLPIRKCSHCCRAYHKQCMEGDRDEEAAGWRCGRCSEQSKQRRNELNPSSRTSLNSNGSTVGLPYNVRTFQTPSSR